jgi:hypothetical protein
MRKYLTILKRPSIIYYFATDPSDFPYIWGKFDFLFYQCDCRDLVNRTERLYACIMFRSKRGHQGHPQTDDQPWRSRPGHQEEKSRASICLNVHPHCTTFMYCFSGNCAASVPISTLMCTRVRFIYSQDRSTNFPAAE